MRLTSRTLRGGPSGFLVEWLHAIFPGESSHGFHGIGELRDRHVFTRAYIDGPRFVVLFHEQDEPVSQIFNMEELATRRSRSQTTTSEAPRFLAS